MPETLSSIQLHNIGNYSFWTSILHLIACIFRQGNRSASCCEAESLYTDCFKRLATNLGEQKQYRKCIYWHGHILIGHIRKPPGIICGERTLPVSEMKMRASRTYVHTHVRIIIGVAISFSSLWLHYLKSNVNLNQTIIPGWRLKRCTGNL